MRAVVEGCREPKPATRDPKPATLASLGDVATRRDLRRGEPIYIDGDRSDRVFFTCGGRVRSTMISNRGQVVTLAHYGPAELFGESDLSGDGPREHSAWTTTPAIIGARGP